MSFVGHLDKMILDSSGEEMEQSRRSIGRGRRGGDEIYTNSIVSAPDDTPDTMLSFESRRRGIQRSARSASPIVVSNPSSIVTFMESPPSGMDIDTDGGNGCRMSYSPPPGQHSSVFSSSSGGGGRWGIRIATDAMGKAFEFVDGDENVDEQNLMEKEHWSREQLDLWHKIRGRGTYPIFPPNWMLDFSNLPDELFVDQGMDPIIYAVNKKMEVKAILAFDNLMQLGGRLRDKWESGQAVEKWLAKELGKYVQWAMKDGKIRRFFTQKRREKREKRRKWKRKKEKKERTEKEYEQKGY